MTLPRILYPQLLENPSFEDGLTDWTEETEGASGSSSAATASTAETYHKDYVLRLDADSATGGYAGVRQDQAYPDLVAGEVYELRLFAKGAGSLYAEVVELTGDSDVEGSNSTDTFTPAAGAWGVHVLTHTIVNASADELRVRLRQTDPGSAVYVDFVALGKIFAPTRYFDRFNYPNRTEVEQDESADGTVETMELFSKDDVDWGWKIVFPALLADIKLFYTACGGGSPFALFFDPSVGSDQAWPRLVFRGGRKLARTMQKGVERFGNIYFKSTEDEE
jgi:hypothetical protein